ncbi:MAG: NADPH:quinone reductase, partial [Hyphomicrobiaceae bacterium]
AVWYEKKGPPHDVLVVGEMPDPVPGPGQVRVRVMVSGLNPSDAKARGFWRNVTTMPFPRVIPHQDGAGVIDQVGPGVAAARVGERVWMYEAQKGQAFGTCAEYVTLDQEKAVPLPDGIGFDVGAALGVPAMTAHNALFKDGGIQGRTILITGAGGAVGQAGVLLAKWAGARVIGTVSTPLAAEVALGSGADAVIDRKKDDVVARVRDLTGGDGVDRILDVAFEDNVEMDLAILKPNGAVASYSAGSPTETVAFPFPRFMSKGITVHTIMVYGMSREAHWAAARDANAVLRAGAYKPRIGARFPLAKAADAHAAQDEAIVVGKIVIDVAGG